MINGVQGQRYGVVEPPKASGRDASVKPSEKSQPVQGVKADTVEIGTKQEASVTYSKTSNNKIDASQIASLKAESEAATENLRKLVEQLILKQNKNYKVSSEPDALAQLEITAEDVEAAKLAVSEDGNFGVKAVSDRLVDFAISISGGDKSKLSELVAAIDEGFAAAKEILGGELPEISRQTYDETMRKLNDWASESDS